MGNRSRYVAMAVAAAGAAGAAAMARARRRRRLGQAVEGFSDAVGPSFETGPIMAEQAPAADELHAPGHQHLGPPTQTGEEERPPALAGRAWTKHMHGLRHPGKGSL